MRRATSGASVRNKHVGKKLYVMKCSFCDREAVYYRANEGKYYCKYHLTRSIEKKVKRTIRQHKLIEEGDVVAVAVSGGKDSMSLLYILNKIYKKNPKVKLFAITINEGTASYREKMIERIRNFCEELGVEHYVFSFKEEFGFGLDEIAPYFEDLCSVCGVLRRWLLNKKARELGATKLATAHNLDDEAQTAIMNFIKGDFQRLARMGAMPYLLKHPKFVLRIKPLVKMPEREMALYAMLNLPGKFFLGSCPYAKGNVLRKETQKFLNRLEAKAPGVKHTLVESAHRLVPILKETYKEVKIGTCKLCGEPSSEEICKACQFVAKARRFLKKR